MPSLLEISRELKSIAEVGLRYTESGYDRQRYERLHVLASEVLQAQAADFVWPVEFGYTTPKVDVRAAVFREGRILLVQETENRLWSLPGGWADVNVTPSENVAREVREEAGLEVTPTHLFACQDRDQHDHTPLPECAYRLFFLCTDPGGDPVPGFETCGAGFFALDDLPDLCPSRCHPSQLRLAAEFAANPSRPAVFD
ncbi:MAG: NUDIX domain-containing protein [Akkermansiaceae bacterium]|nr:NUDIX domain-containing protein [Akkermansiaceae bacterium]NNM28853.1 NUDIX domain-containing protein [Akkermansiaceae bacterium]